jgi:hypothetical protein
VWDTGGLSEMILTFWRSDNRQNPRLSSSRRPVVGVVHSSPLCNLSPPDLRGGLFFAIRGHCTDTAAFLALHSRQRNQRSRSTNPTWWWAASAALFRE